MSLTLYTFVRLIFEGGLYSFLALLVRLLFKRGLYSRGAYNSENTVGIPQVIKQLITDDHTIKTPTESLSNAAK